MNPVTEFEKRIAEFFGAPYGVAVDSCTHGLELCLRYMEAYYIHSPNRTYLSIPMLAEKLNLPLKWIDCYWRDFYCLYALGSAFAYPVGIYDAAVLWRKNSYVQGSLMCISFQYQKHLSLGRGGMILTNNKEAAIQLKKMSYDGREPNIPWREQNIDTIGYHYYMTPETAQLGLDKLDKAITTPPRIWDYSDYPDLTQMKIFKT